MEMEPQKGAQFNAAPTQPESPPSRIVMYLWVGALVAVALAGLVFVSLRTAGANVDYICTKVVESDGPCANGSWGTWETVSENTEGGGTTVVQRRTYTGTRTASKTLEYISTRTRCEAGYTERALGSGGDASGFRSGTVTTAASACQIVQTQTLTRRGGGGGGGGGFRRDVSVERRDT